MKTTAVSRPRPAAPAAAPPPPAPAAAARADTFAARADAAPKTTLPTTPTGPGNAVALRAAEAKGDPHPIGTARALGLTLGLEAGIDARVPFLHLRTLGEIRALRPKMLALSTEALGAAHAALRAKVAAGAPLPSVRAEAFAIAREVARRTLGKEPYEVQLLAAMAVSDGSIAELKTGEGKSLAIAVAATLLAADGRGCHVATTSDYLAARDARDHEPLYAALGLTVGVTTTAKSYADKRAAYAADLTYGHADTFAFDWLEDQTWWRADWRVQRGLVRVVVDEADDVLLDNALDPLVLCGGATSGPPVEEKTALLRVASQIAHALDPATDLAIRNERGKVRPFLTDLGVDKVEALMAEHLGIVGAPTDVSARVWAPENGPLLAYVYQALEAAFSVQAGRDYVSAEGAPTLVSTGTGHPQPGARLRHGLMDAVRAKEGLLPEADLETIGLVSYQGFFRQYERLAGTTGTTRGVRDELREIYGLSVVEIPTHKPIQRVDEPDQLFPHPAHRLLAAVADVARTHQSGRPVLVSTVSVEASRHVSARLAEPRRLLVDVALSSDGLLRAALAELAGGPALLATLPRPTRDADRARVEAEVQRLARADAAGLARFAELLESKGLPARAIAALAEGLEHAVLNAETHAREAEILSQAGRAGAITVATQMAGRGVDIPLGEGVAELGGLAIVGIERKINRRKDDQVVGRAGRQGQPGSSRFYLSPADELFTHLPAHQLRALAAKVRADRIEPPSGILRRAWEGAIDAAQRRVEADASFARKKSTKLGGAIEAQLRSVVKWREELLASDALFERMTYVVLDAMDAAEERRDLASLRAQLSALGLPASLASLDPDERAAKVERRLLELGAARQAARGEDDAAMNQYLRDMILFNLNSAWIDHVRGEESHKEHADLATFAGRDPFVEFTEASSRRFLALKAELEDTIRARFVHHLTTG